MRVTPRNLVLCNMTFRPHVSVPGSQNNFILFTCIKLLERFSCRRY